MNDVEIEREREGERRMEEGEGDYQRVDIQSISVMKSHVSPRSHWSLWLEITLTEGKKREGGKGRRSRLPIMSFSFSLGDVSWQIAVPRDTSNEQALEVRKRSMIYRVGRETDYRSLQVEQCSCPPGYVGTSCEDCAPGYERSGHGPYLGTCVPIREVRIRIERER